MKFDDYYIAPQIKKNLALLGFKNPTDIQFKSIPSILKGEDVLAIAQTGTGKTAAFAIPIINNIQASKIKNRRDGVKCLVMVPTRELAIQVSEVFTEIARFTDVTTFCIYGGVEQQSQIEKLEYGVDILVATPGRMFDMISQGYLRLHRINTLILDEADHMLDLGFIEDITDIKSKLSQRHQTLFFSATINKDIKRLAYSLVSNAIRIQVSPKDPVSENVSHSVVFVEMDDKRFFLERFLKDNPDGKVLVFVRTKVRAERVLKAMERVGLSCTTLHGDKEQHERATLLGDFKTGKTKVLIATDISARGIDVPNVDFVINYDLPDKSENYVHRVGRTGRGTQKGQAISFCSKDEKIILDNIEGFLGNNIEIMAVSNLDYEQTKDLSSDGTDDWQSLLDMDESFEKKKKKK